jgi:hypothetical protein
LKRSGSGETASMEQHAGQSPEPRDATEATEEQRELQEQLDHQSGTDPEGPGLRQSRRQVADET